MTALARSQLLFVLGSVAAFAPLSIDMYLPAFPAIGRDLEADVSLVQHTLSAYFIGLCIGQLFYGPISDRFGRLVPLCAGQLVYVLASAGCAVAGDIETLITLRIVQALGGCAGSVIVVAIVRDLFDPQTSARVFSRLMIVMGLVPILAPLSGTYLAEWVGWRSIFWCQAGLGAAGLAAIMVGLKETRPVRAGTSLRPSAVLQNYYALVTDRHFLGHALTGALANGAYFVYLAGSPFVLMGIFAVSPRAYGWLFALNSMGLVLGSQVNDWLLARHPLEKLLSRANGIAMVLAAALLLLSITELGGVIAFATFLFGFVASRAFIRSNAIAAALEFQAARAGTASALAGAMQFAFGTLGGALLSVLHDGTSRPLTLLLTLYAVLGLTLHRALAHGMRSRAV